MEVSGRVFTAGLDIGENVCVVMQVFVEDEAHGELSEDETQLMRKRKKTEGITSPMLNTTYNIK